MPKGVLATIQEEIFVGPSMQKIYAKIHSSESNIVEKYLKPHFG